MKTTTRNATIALVGAIAILATAGAAPAAVDPDLLILESKVNGVGREIDAVNTRIAVVGGQFEALFEAREEGLAAVGDKRRREIESILLGCALDPGNCIPPLYMVTNLLPDCFIDGEVEEPAPGEHEHDLGAACPLKEVVDTVARDLIAAREQGLDRDYLTAEGHLVAAVEAAQASDPHAAFAEACNAFRILACP